MSRNARDNRPYIRPVTRLELDQTNVKLRWILVAVFLVIGIGAFGFGLNSLLKTEPGWQSVKAAPDGPNAGPEFVMMYNFSDLGATASQVNKQLELHYSQICEDAFTIFSPDISAAGVGNVNLVNGSVNREISVEPALYRAFELLEEYGNRCIYLAPVYAEYDSVFQSESDPEAMDNDPAHNPEVRAYVDELIRYTSNPEMIRLELLGDNKVCLHVSEEYLAFAKENGIDEFIDFGWMRNAFIADYLAEQLISAGYTNGYLVSYDGFTRNLVDSEDVFRMNLFDRHGNDINLPAIMDYNGPTSLVFLHSYPLNELEEWTTYTYSDGSVVTSMIDPADGVSKSSRNNLVSYSKSLGCAEIVLNMIPVYLTDNFSKDACNALIDEAIHSVWFEDGTLYHNDPALQLEMKADANGDYYQKSLVK